ncbi:MAG: hypothetical protein U9N44_01820 [Chloroflexota bacterium]|nr:hypothetical protein [Chloroflexota bacterium]
MSWIDSTQQLGEGLMVQTGTQLQISAGKVIHARGDRNGQAVNQGGGQGGQ